MSPLKPSSRFPLIVLGAALSLGAPLSVHGATVWVGGAAGSWGDPANWSTGAVPAAGADVLINDGGLVEAVTVDQDPDLNSLTLSDGSGHSIADSVGLDNGRFMRIRGGGVVMDGALEINGDGNFTVLSFLAADQSLGGHGEVVMSDSAMNRIQTAEDILLTVGPDITVRGAGSLLGGANGGLGGFDNRGTIMATGAGHALTIDPGNRGFAQQGVLRAAGAGGLKLSNGSFDLVNPVEVLAASGLTIENSTVRDGTVDIAAGAVATVRNGSVFEGVTIQGEVDQENGATATFHDGLALEGEWRLNAAGSFTNMNFVGTQTLSGDGDVVLSDDLRNRILVTSGDTLTVGDGIALRGGGKLLVNNQGSLVNEGRITADGARDLTLQPLAVENRGVVVAAGSGGIRVLAADYVQTAGETRVESRLEVSPGRVARIQGGILGGGGEISGTVDNSGGTVAPGNSVGTLTIRDGNYIQGAGGLFVVEIGGAGDFDVLDVFGSATLDGTLEVALVNGFRPALGDTFDVLLANSIGGAFANDLVDLGGVTFDIGLFNAGGRDGVRLTTSAVPLPASVWLLLSAALGLFALRRRDERRLVTATPA